MTKRLDPRLREWRERHRPTCSTCLRRDTPPLECARIWAPSWAAEAFPVNELADPELDERMRLEQRIDSLETELSDFLRESGDVLIQRDIRLLELERDLESTRQEASKLREALNEALEQAAEDLDAANNWRRYVAVVGEQRASLYLVPPKKEEEH